MKKANIQSMRLGRSILLYLAAALVAPSILWAQTAQAPPAAEVAATVAAVVINEVLAHTDLPLKDTVELYNTGVASVDISHWCLTDKSDEPCLLVFPAGSVIPPHGYHLVLLDDDSPFRLSEFGETLTLSAASAGGVVTGAVDSVKFGATPNGVSVGRVVTSDGRSHFPLMRSLTLGATNGPPQVSPIVISEILFRAAPGKPQYIAVRNHTSAAQIFHHPELADAPWEVDGIGAVAIPDDVVLAPGEMLYVSSGTPDAMRTAYGLASNTKVYGPWAGTLQTNGENIELKRPDRPDEAEEEMPMIAVDAVDFAAVAPWPPVANNSGVAIRRLSPGLLGSEPRNWTGGEVQSVFLPTARQ